MSKQYILFIVEGKNDEKEINAILNTPKFSDAKNKYVFLFKKVGGDITTGRIKGKNNKPKKVQGILNNMVSQYRKKEGPYRDMLVRDFYRVIQIVDLDGAFIPEENIWKGDFSGFYYEDDGITTSNVDYAIGRNRKKSQILNELITVQCVDNIPYSIYFASCNMDHVLFNKRNSTETGKRNDADEFILNCKYHPEILYETIFNETIAIESSYESSWNFIQEGLNSLQRRTNINILLNDYIAVAN